MRAVALHPPSTPHCCVLTRSSHPSSELIAGGHGGDDDAADNADDAASGGAAAARAKRAALARSRVLRAAVAALEAMPAFVLVERCAAPRVAPTAVHPLGERGAPNCQSARQKVHPTREPRFVARGASPIFNSFVVLRLLIPLFTFSVTPVSSFTLCSLRAPPREV